MSFLIVGVSGSTRRPSRTTELVADVGREVARRRAVRFELVEVAGIGPGLGAASREELPEVGKAALAAIESADALIVGSPIYKGSYTGLLLVGRPVALMATGGGRRHALAVEHQLRPLFGFFSALTLPTSVYASDEDFRDGKLADPGTIDRVRQVASELVAQLTTKRPVAVTPATPVALERVA